MQSSRLLQRSTEVSSKSCHLACTVHHDLDNVDTLAAQYAWYHVTPLLTHQEQKGLQGAFDSDFFATDPGTSSSRRVPLPVVLEDECCQGVTVAGMGAENLER